MLDYLRAGAVIVCVEYDDAPGDFSVAGNRGGKYHLKLARLVVFPQRSN